MRHLIIAAVSVLLFAGSAAAEMVKLASPHSVAVTMDRLEAAVKGAGANVFARIDHQAAAASIDVAIPASTVMFFGSPKIGAPIMLDGITIGLDLPLRALAYQDGDKVWLVYHNPTDMAAQHGIPADHPVLQKIKGALGKLTGKAIAP
jgi:uncharacterized protein (DUF302 family)